MELEKTEHEKGHHSGAWPGPSPNIFQPDIEGKKVTIGRLAPAQRFGRFERQREPGGPRKRSPSGACAPTINVFLGFAGRPLQRFVRHFTHNHSAELKKKVTSSERPPFFMMTDTNYLHVFFPPGRLLGFLSGGPWPWLAGSKQQTRTTRK